MLYENILRGCWWFSLYIIYGKRSEQSFKIIITTTIILIKKFVIFYFEGFHTVTCVPSFDWFKNPAIYFITYIVSRVKGLSHRISNKACLFIWVCFHFRGIQSRVKSESKILLISSDIYLRSWLLKLVSQCVYYFFWWSEVSESVNLI